jgi:Flp pilus assembly pilin Flp
MGIEPFRIPTLSLKGEEKGRIICKARRSAAMWHLWKKRWNRKGQSIIEYAMVAAIVGAAVLAMGTYVYRSVQETQQVIQKEFGKK